MWMAHRLIQGQHRRTRHAFFFQSRDRIFALLETCKPFLDYRFEVVAVLGTNGAGKTTSISIMLGLRKPTSGRVHLMGVDPRDARARSRAGAMLQESGVPQGLRVKELRPLVADVVDPGRGGRQPFAR